MEESLARFFMSTSTYSVALPLIVGLMRIKRLQIIQRYVLALVIFSILVELAAVLLGRVLHLRNLPLLHLFSAVQFTLLWFIFAKRLIPPFSKRFFGGILIAFWSFAIICAIWIDGIYNFNAHARSFGAILIIIFCLCYFYQRLRKLDLDNLETDPLFWVTTGSLIYFSGSLILFIISNYILSDKAMSFSMWGVHGIFNTFNNLFFMIALWVQPTK
ncbi:MAG: hypothetical protein ACRBG0_23545 [Lewinella sp.]|uniref:hypothetical protein n=1 Tax=Lewinella sp. TaxID=2004506 RepID=UPI003D6A417B